MKGKRLLMIALVLGVVLSLTTCFGTPRTAPRDPEPSPAAAETVPPAAGTVPPAPAQGETPPPTAAAAPRAAAPEMTEAEQEIVLDMIRCYSSYGEGAAESTAASLARLRELDPVLADKWAYIMELWTAVNRGIELHEGILPDGLADTDELCIVVLGFQLNADGSMAPELLGRLNVALACAEKYPNALIVCTGGGTAAYDASATEAGRMAAWLAEHGVAEERIIVEDRSLTTAQNAMYTYRILLEQYPQVRQIALVSSDYHLATGTLLFGAEAMLLAEKPGAEPFTLVANAAYAAPSGSLTLMFQAGELLELAGDREGAYRIYAEGGFTPGR